ncbi:hypothetical protein ASF06_09220 [Agreia sp. Leaf244]|nr:hypothetical protein ASF06_09220 [Agreia sp. Leaf244]
MHTSGDPIVEMIEGVPQSCGLTPSDTTLMNARVDAIFHLVSFDVQPHLIIELVGLVPWLEQVISHRVNKLTARGHRLAYRGRIIGPQSFSQTVDHSQRVPGHSGQRAINRLLCLLKEGCLDLTKSKFRVSIGRILVNLGINCP